MSCWTLLLPLAAAVMGFTLSDRDHKATKFDHDELKKEVEELRSDLYSAHLELEREKEATDYWRSEAWDWRSLANKTRRYPEIIAMLKRSKARANSKNI